MADLVNCAFIVMGDTVHGKAVQLGQDLWWLVVMVTAQRSRKRTQNTMEGTQWVTKPL